MKLIDQKLIDEFLNLARAQLTGEWILIGGALMHALGISERVTMDIDLTGKSEKDMAQMLQVMDLASQLGLPVEAINQAGAHFLHQVPSFEQHLLVMIENDNFTLYRPDLYLYLHLKLSRLTESDCTDCLSYIEYTKQNLSHGQDELNESNLLMVDKLIKEHLKKANRNQNRYQRLEKVALAMGAF